MVGNILIVICVFGLILVISNLLMLYATDTHENLKIILIIIGIVLIMGSAIGVSIYNLMQPGVNTIIITTDSGEEIYTNCKVITRDHSNYTEVIIVTDDKEQIVYINPIKYEVK